MFRNLLENLPGVAVQGYETDGTVRYWNRASEDIYGYTAEEAVGRNLGDLIIPPEIRHLFDKGLEFCAAAVRTGEFMPGGECELLRKDGSKAPVYSKHTAVCLKGSPPLLFCIDVDLTERRKAEQTLRESEQRFRELAELLPEIVVETDLAGSITFANLNMLKAGGYTQDDLRRGMNVFELVAPEDRARARQDFQKGAAGQTSGPYEFTVQRRDGSRFPVRAYASPVVVEGQMAGIRAIAVDVTEQKRAEQALRESEERFREIYEHSLIGIYRTTPDGGVLMANPALLRMLGYGSFEELSRLNLEDGGYAPGYSRADFRKRIESEEGLTGYE